MVKKGLLFSLLLTLTFSLPVAIQSQDLGSIDFRTVNVDEMSDSELRQINREIRDRGLSLQQFQQLAIAQGGDQARVQRLVSRLRQVAEAPGDPDRIDQFVRPPGEVRFIGDLEDRTFQELETDTVPDSLQIFGMDLFDRVSMSFEPSFNVPTPQNYTLGPGDQLVIDIWGAAEQNYRLMVGSEGNIRVDNLGPIQVSGMTVEEADERIRQRLSSIYSGLSPNLPEQANTYGRVSLGNIRSVKVTVMGEVKQPGTYTVSSLSTLFNALYAAGGPNRTGTFRNIQVLRDQQVIHTFDIYDFLIHGNQEGNIRLKDQDIIKVDPYINRVHVWGEMKRKGFFEMKNGETVEDLITYAAGFNEGAYTRSLTLHSTSPTMHRISNVLYPEGATIELQNGDRLRVGELLERYENRVTLQGAVFRPGEYELESGMTLYDLINKADGLREEAFMQRGQIERYRENRESEVIGFSLAGVIDDPVNNDILLRPDDVVRISSIFEMRESYTVRVRGAVNHPTTLRFRENMTVEDVILQADGFRDEAASYRVEVARRVVGDDDPDQYKMDRVAETFSFNVDKDLGFRSEDADFVLRPFDQVYIRAQPNYQEQQTVMITGEVEYPGVYVLENRNARLSDLIEQSGGLSAYAFPRGASLERILEISRRPQITEIDNPDTENGAENGEVTDTLRTPVGIRLQDALGAPRSGQDLILEDGDVLHVPKELQTVRVEGEVLSPTSVRYDPGRSFSDYLSAAGGVTEDAKRKRTYVVYANGEVDRTRSFLGIRSNPDVEPGATIIVPPEPERRELTPQERISLASSIASTMLVIVTVIDRLR